MAPGRCALAAAALFWVLALACAGCDGEASASGPATASPQASEGATQCRQQWRGVQGHVHGRDDRGDPSDLAPQWTAVVAAVRYYAQGATARDCRTALPAERRAIARIEGFSRQLRRFDIAHRLGSAAPAALDYLATTPAPRPGNDTGRHTGQHTRPPTAKQVRAALDTLHRRIPASVDDLRPGWDEAGSVDLTDAGARRRVLADLRLLARDSAAFQQCTRALDVLERAGALAHRGDDREPDGPGGSASATPTRTPGVSRR